MTDRLYGLVERELRRRGGGEAELYLRHARVRRFESRDGGIDSIQRSESVSLSLRVFRNGRMGFSFGFGDGEETVRRMVEAALFGADASDPDDAHRLPAGPVPSGSLPLCDPEAGRAEDRALADFACDLEARTLAVDSRMKRVRSAVLRETVAEERFFRSDGRRGERRESSVVATVDAVAEEGAEAQSGYGFGFARSLAVLSAEAVGAEAASRALRMLGARPLRSGRIPAVLEAGATADLLEVLAPSFLASHVAKGKSMLAGKRGARIAAETVTIADDPLDPDGSAAAEFDGEGIASRRNLLVDRGVLAGYLADTFWGTKTGTGTTGSGRRASAKVPPAPGVSNLRLLPGEFPPGALLRELGRGVLLTEFLGIHTADPVSGDFSVGAAGIRFERGEPAEPVRGFAVSGNVLTLLADAVGVGSDFRWFGSTGAPSLAVSGVEIGGE
ncbi:MAG: TldD/PmbA family protein [Deltaproteobacteria bacterium]